MFWFLIWILFVGSLTTTPPFIPANSYTDPPVHPLNPLTANEQALAAQIVLTAPQWTSRSRIDRLGLLLPSRQSTLAWTADKPLLRIAEVSTYDPSSDTYYEYNVYLNNASYSVKIVPGARPPWTNTDNANILDLILNDPAYQNALASRGVTIDKFTNQQVQPYTLLDGRLNFPASTIGMPNLTKDIRSWWGTTLLLDKPLDDYTYLANYYVYPIPGVIWWADANSQKVLLIHNGSEVSPLPITPGLLNINYPPNAYAADYRKQQNPIVLNQPNGPSFRFTSANTLTWHKWIITYDVNDVVGLRLFNIQYNDNGKIRPIIHQHNFHEAFTSYGSNVYGDQNMNYWDFGEYPYKYFASPLDNEAHGLPPYAVFLPAAFTDETGQAYTISNAMAIYEVPDGMLWSHYEYWTGTTQGRTHIKLKLSFAVTVGNYDYLLTYTFGMDGTIQTTVVPTGFDEMSAGDKNTETSRLIHQGIIAANHQHYFGVRTDWYLDGQVNSIYQADKVHLASVSDGAWIVNKTLIETTQGRMADMMSDRTWLVVNEQARNSLGDNPSYSIMVETPASLLAGPQARISTRTNPLLTNDIFVTKYRDDQQYFVSKYPVEKDHVDGVTPEQYSESVVNTSIVTWTMMGVSHAPRPEDFPVLPAGMMTSIKFTPNGFFDQNPAMDADIGVVTGSNKHKPTIDADNGWRRRMKAKLKSVKRKLGN